MNELETFGKLIKEARQEKRYNQRQLSEKLGIDFTYLSKLENGRLEYAPKEDIIRQLAYYLDLQEDELIFLVGRIPTQDEDFMKQHYQNMPLLFRRMRENPEFAAKIFHQAKIHE